MRVDVLDVKWVGLMSEHYCELVSTVKAQVEYAQAGTDAAAT